MAESRPCQQKVTTGWVVLNKISFVRRNPVEIVENFVERALFGGDRIDLDSQRRHTLNELRGRRRGGGRGRTPEVRRELFCFTRGAAQQEPAPIGFGESPGRLVEIDLVEHDNAVEIQAEFTALEARFASAATIE